MLSTGRAPAPATMACWMSVPPMTAATVGSFLIGVLGLLDRGLLQQLRDHGREHLDVAELLRADAEEQVAVLAGDVAFQAWNMYCIATVISPYWPPSTSCMRCGRRRRRARSGLALNWSSCLWKNTCSSSREGHLAAVAAALPVSR